MPKKPMDPVSGCAVIGLLCLNCATHNLGKLDHDHYAVGQRHTNCGREVCPSKY